MYQPNETIHEAVRAIGSNLHARSAYRILSVRDLPQQFRSSFYPARGAMDGIAVVHVGEVARRYFSDPFHNPVFVRCDPHAPDVLHI